MCIVYAETNQFFQPKILLLEFSQLIFPIQKNISNNSSIEMLRSRHVGLLMVIIIDITNENFNKEMTVGLQ